LHSASQSPTEPPTARPTAPFLIFQADPDYVEGGRTVELPYLGKGEEDIVVFVYDAETENELNSDQSSRGTLEIREATCEPEARVSLRIEGDLGSELGHDRDGAEITGDVDVVGAG